MDAKYIYNTLRELLPKNDLRKREHYLRRYVKFLCSCNIIESGENHHIIPKSMLEEYQKESWNKKRISHRAHYLAHWMLAKAYGSKMWFAFNNMKRILPKNGPKKSALYEKSRRYISEVISISNTGKKHTRERKMQVAQQMKDMVVVKDKDGNTMQVSVNDERYLNGELVFYRVGSTHKKSTIDKMRIASNSKNKGVIYYNVITGKTIYSKKSPGIDWEKGLSPARRKNQSKAASATVWFHDPISGKDRRLKHGVQPPAHYILGRRNGPGFSIINERRICTKK